MKTIQEISLIIKDIYFTTIPPFVHGCQVRVNGKVTVTVTVTVIFHQFVHGGGGVRGLGMLCSYFYPMIRHCVTTVTLSSADQ